VTKIIPAMLFLLLANTAFAIDASESLEDPALQARYEALIAEVRCMQCQNQSIKDSNAFLASDLRREIRELLRAGKTDAEIEQFLVARYGEFVLYRPRMAGRTLILWIAPLALLAIGAFVALRIARGRARLPLEDA
jgi:cytochrome c-type biogenesis protein CcmH